MESLNGKEISIFPGKPSPRHSIFKELGGEGAPVAEGGLIIMLTRAFWPRLLAKAQCNGNVINIRAH